MSNRHFRDIKPIVFVINGSKEILESLKMLLRRVQVKVQIYDSPQDFLNDYDPAQSGCLVLNVIMPGMSGLEFQSKLLADGIKIPLIFVTTTVPL